MRTINELLREYAKSHTNPTNKLIHQICVPAIMFSIIGLFMCIPFYGISPAILLIVAASIYYFYLSKKYFFIMLIAQVLMYFGNVWLALHVDLLYASILIFSVSWVFQFIGHKIEGAKPSFLDDLLFLFIGPIWVFKGLLKLK